MYVHRRQSSTGPVFSIWFVTLLILVLSILVRLEILDVFPEEPRGQLSPATTSEPEHPP